MTNFKNRVALYLRVSTTDQDFRSQRTAVADYCKRRGWTKPAVYAEKASGSKARRTVLDTLMQDARSGKINIVVVYKLDRLGRSLGHFLQIMREFDSLNVGIISASQGIDTTANNPLAKVLINLLGTLAEFEGDQIRERTIAGINSARRRGRRLGRPPIPEPKKNQVRSLRRQLNDKKRPMPLREIAKLTGLSIGAVSEILSDKSS